MTRSPKSREAVHEILRQSPGFRSAQDVFAEMRADGAKIGLTPCTGHCSRCRTRAE